MKKIFLLGISALLFTGNFAWAQPFTFVRTDPYPVYMSVDSFQIKVHANVNNLTSQVIPLNITITNRYVTPGWDSIGMCTWIACYPPGSYSVTENCSPGQHVFYVYFTPYGIPGEGHCTVTITYQSTSVSQDFAVVAMPIGIKQISTIVKDFSLEQNYPNPFNPATRITFSIPRKEAVYLRVYDLLGREVKTLINEELPAGEYEYDFEAKNMSSGFYYYSLRSGEYVAVKKMVLVK